MRGRPIQKGFTLVELLAVAALLALLAVATAGAIAPMTSGQQAVLAESTIREAAQRARLVAQRRGGCELVLGERLEVRPRLSGAGARSTVVGLPKGWRIQLAQRRGEPEAAAPVVAFGPDGVANDLEFALLGPRKERMHLRLFGISGIVERSEVRE